MIDAPFTIAYTSVFFTCIPSFIHVATTILLADVVCGQKKISMVCKIVLLPVQANCVALSYITF